MNFAWYNPEADGQKPEPIQRPPADWPTGWCKLCEVPLTHATTEEHRHAS